MAGTVMGGIKASKTNKRIHGRNFYKKIGKMGGTISRGGGFTDKELARRAGAKGGKISKRGREDFFVKIPDADIPVIDIDQPTWRDKIFRRWNG